MKRLDRLTYSFIVIIYSIALMIMTLVLFVYPLAFKIRCIICVIFIKPIPMVMNNYDLFTTL